MIAAILIYPIIIAPLVFVLKSKKLNDFALILYALLFAGASVSLYVKPANFTAYFGVDPLNILFLLILAVLFLGVSIYNLSYFKHSDVSLKIQTEYTAMFLLFVGAMAGVILARHLALLWVFIEATTLFSAPLIIVERSRSALEAAWKYIFICSIGIAIAFVGIILLSIGTGNLNSLFFSDLYRSAGQLVPFWLKLSFPFILVGLGTKMGLAPVHAWLPDAHSESPSPVSAMLSGTLLNAALLGILRVYKLMDLAHLGHYAKALLVIMGFLSLTISAIFILRTNNFKRMLAYSSIENMGIIVLGVGTGGIAYYASLLHMISHSLTKGAFFFTAGNLVHRFHSKEIDRVKGLLRKDVINGWLWVACFVAISGIPPFPAFISEFLMLKGVFEKNYIFTAILFFLLLTIIMYGMGRSVLQMSFGRKNNSSITLSNPEHSLEKPLLSTYLPQIVFMAILLIIGLMMPNFLNTLITNAANELSGMPGFK